MLSPASYRTLCSPVSKIMNQVKYQTSSQTLHSWTRRCALLHECQWRNCSDGLMQGSWLLLKTTTLYPEETFLTQYEHICRSISSRAVAYIWHSKWPLQETPSWYALASITLVWKSNVFQVFWSTSRFRQAFCTSIRGLHVPLLIFLCSDLDLLYFNSLSVLALTVSGW